MKLACATFHASSMRFQLAAMASLSLPCLEFANSVKIAQESSSAFLSWVMERQRFHPPVVEGQEVARGLQLQEPPACGIPLGTDQGVGVPQDRDPLLEVVFAA